MKVADLKASVREHYGAVAQNQQACCCGGSCHANEYSKLLGYKDEDLQAVPEGANLGLGCGSPLSIAALKPGQTVLDLGSGAGFDVFLAARKVGDTGKVYGVDMTPAMLEKARANAKKGGYTNVEFIEGEIENIPLPDSSVDVVISNCVINLSPDKAQVFRETFRVLRPGGKLMVSDVVLEKPLPRSVKESVEAYVGCIAGALLQEKYLELITAAGFTDVQVVAEKEYEFDGKELKKQMLGGEQETLAHAIKSIHVSAIKRG